MSQTLNVSFRGQQLTAEFGESTALALVSANSAAADAITAAADRVLAQAARVAAEAAAGAAQGMANFRATFAEAIAAFAVGVYFTSTESGAIRMYKRTATTPFYVDQGDVAAPLSVGLMGGATGSLQIGHTASGAGSSARTVQAKLREAPTVEDHGALGDGSTSDATAIYNAFAAAVTTREPAFASRTYGLAGVPIGVRNYDEKAVGNPQPGFAIPPGTRKLDGGGAVFNAANGLYAFVFGVYWSHAVGQGLAASLYGINLSGNLAAGAVDFPLVASGGANFVAGDSVRWQLGELAYDLPETHNWGLAKVVSVTGDTVKLDKPNPIAFTLASVTWAGSTPFPPNKVLRKAPVLRDCVIGDLTVSYAAGQGGHAFDLSGGERLTIQRFGNYNAKNGMVFQYCDGLTVSECWQEGMTITDVNSGSFMRFAECRNVLIDRPRASGTRHFIGCEAGAEVTVISPKMENNATSAGVPRTDVRAFNSVGNSSITVNDFTATGFGGYDLSVTGNGVAGASGTVTLNGTTRLTHPTELNSIQLWNLNGVLDMKIAGVREIWDFQNTRTVTRRVYLKNGMFNYLSLGAFGPVKRCEVYCSPGLATLGAGGANGIGAAGPLNNLYVSKVGGSGVIDLIYTFTTAKAGKLTEYPVYGGALGTQHWTERALENNIIVGTTSGTALDAANEFVEIRLEVATRVDIPEVAVGAGITISEANWRGLGDDAEELEATFVAYDLANIAAAGTLQVDLPIADMAAGDLVTSVSFANGLTGLSIRSAEAIAGNCRIVFENQTAAAIDKAATNIVVRFVKPQAGA